MTSETRLFVEPNDLLSSRAGTAVALALFQAADAQLVCNLGLKTKSRTLAQICATTLKIKGLWVNCLSRGHGRNVARYGANVSRFTRLPAAKLTRFGAGMAILLLGLVHFGYAGLGICRTPSLGMFSFRGSMGS
jgi:hypothetical protein